MTQEPQKKTASIYKASLVSIYPNFQASRPLPNSFFSSPPSLSSPDHSHYRSHLFFYIFNKLLLIFSTRIHAIVFHVLLLLLEIYFLGFFIWLNVTFLFLSFFYVLKSFILIIFLKFLS